MCGTQCAFIRVTTVPCGFVPWAAVAVCGYSVSRLLQVFCGFDPLLPCFIDSGRCYVASVCALLSHDKCYIGLVVPFLYFQTLKLSIVPGPVGSGLGVRWQRVSTHSQVAARSFWFPMLGYDRSGFSAKY